jgi:hypothetical protein
MISKEDKKKALAYIKARFPVGTEIWDPTCSQPYRIREYSVFDIYDDLDDMAEPCEALVQFEFLVHNPGKLTRTHWVQSTPKRWVLDYYNEKLKK